MVLVDTSIWVDHFRTGNEQLEELLTVDSVATHRYVIGELSCGHMDDRSILRDMAEQLTLLPTVDLYELLHFTEAQQLVGSGLNFVDLNLLASMQIMSEPIVLWTNDRAMQRAAASAKLVQFLH